MSLARTFAIARRIVFQIVRDRRTVALVVIVPLVITGLVGLTFSGMPGVLDFVAPALLGGFVFFFAFILTGISFLRERIQGTLERLWATPVRRGEVLLGYLAGFLLFAFVQAMLVMFFTLFVLDVQRRGALAHILLLLVALATVAVNLGVFVSTFARNEFQVMQFIPLVILPQLFLSGVLLPVGQMPGYLQAASRALPLTYAVRGLREVMLEGKGMGEAGPDLAVLAGFAVLMLLLAVGVTRRA